jgi:apoptosis-inducing factor 3
LKACFSLSTGDIGNNSTQTFPTYPTHPSLEDAPAPNGIHCFQAVVKDGKIEVTANSDFVKKENSSAPPKTSTAGFDQIGTGLVSVGGGQGGFHVAESMRNVSFLRSVHVPTKH